MRKSKEDTQLTREKIIESAFESFFELGYAETSLSLIAENAGMTRGAIYWHFKDKNELYREVVKIAAEKADVVKFAYSLSEDLSYKERMLSLFLFLRIIDMWILSTRRSTRFRSIKNLKICLR